MIRYLTAEEKPLSRDLWEKAFPEDSRSFDDYYYSEKIKGNRILALYGEEPENAGTEAGAEASADVRMEERPGGASEMEAPGDVPGTEARGGLPRIDAMIQLNPYLLQVGPRRWRVDYLVGVATRKDRRHRGYMRRLLLRMMADMRAEGTPFCFLMPADEAIYRPFGFTYIFDQPRWRLRPEAEAHLCRRDAAELPDAAGAWMERWLANRYQVYAVRDGDYVRMLAAETASEDGRVDALYDGPRLIGFHSMWGWQEKEQRLLYAEPSYIEEAAPPKPAIMARIISPETFVRAVRLRDRVKAEEVVISLALEDPLIGENQGIWRWHLNHQTSWLEPGETAGGEPLRLTVTELTAWLFGYEIPEAAKTWETVVQPLQGVFLDEVV